MPSRSDAPNLIALFARSRAVNEEVVVNEEEAPEPGPTVREKPLKPASSADSVREPPPAFTSRF
jgi:hypothetical protein